MGLFDFLGARDAYGQVNDYDRPRHEVTHELIAGAAGFEARRQARDQADYLWQQQYGGY
jgi:hypothetical protein